MPEFFLTTTWLIPAPVETVWSCLIHSEMWPLWWKYVETVQETSPGDSSGLNMIRRYHWRTCLPYSLRLDMRVTEIHPNRLIAVEVNGDLQGEGRCQLTYQHSDALTQVVFDWRVRTCKPWMDWFSFVMRPVFAWNHGRVMKLGEESLIQFIKFGNRPLEKRGCY